MSNLRNGPRLNLSEISGSLGDLATFLPLAIGLIAVNGVNATSLFLSAGLLYIAAGLYYGLPIPVQPLKATSAIAIAMGATPETIAAAALCMGVLFAGVSLFDGNRLLGRVFPRPIVRGIQLGLSVLLVKGGLIMLLPRQAVAFAGPASLSVMPAVAIGIVVAGILFLSRQNRRYPSALVVIAFGIACGLLLSSFDALDSLSAGWVRPEWGLPVRADLRTAILVLLLPQVPLTFANSVVATAETSRQYFGDDARRVTLRRLAASLGIANLFAGLIGGMPMCHGSGGVTAHYRFGARTGGANLFIGGLFVALALLFGKSIAALFGLLPSPVLGILLLYVGIEHARLVRDIVEVPRELAVAVGIGLLTLATGNLAIAFAAGILLNALCRRLLRNIAWGGTV